MAVHPDQGVWACIGLLVPDIPLEETDDIRRIASAAGLELVMLVTPTTPEARMRAIAAVSQGFVYLVSVAGAEAPYFSRACLSNFQLGWYAVSVRHISVSQMSVAIFLQSEKHGQSGWL